MTDPVIPAPAVGGQGATAAAAGPPGLGGAGDVEDGERLECGADPSLLLEQVGQGRGTELSPHQVQCPFCRAELERDLSMWAPVQALAREPVRAPEGMLSRAMAWIRSVMAEDVDIGPVGAGVEGRTSVAAQAILRTARTAAQAVDGVRLALSRVVPPGPRQLGSARTGQKQDTGSMVVELTLAVDYGHDLQVLGSRVMIEVSRAVEVLLGVVPDAVSVHIDDVLDTTGPTPV